MPYIANPLEGLPIRNSFITDQSSLGAAPATDDTIIIYDLSGTEVKQLTIANLFNAPAITGNATAATQSSGNNSTRIATTAYVDAATGALNTVSEMTDVTITSIASGELLKWNGSAWINNTLAEAGIAPVATPTFTTSITIGSAVITEADLEQIDDLTAGTAVASKALVVDGNKDIGTIRNLTIDGVFTDGNYTFDTSGNVSGLGTIGSGAITSSGIVTGTGFTAGSAVLAEAELELLDGLTAGTAIASKVVTTDSNIDTTGQRNITITGELDAATLDISGNADIDGTLEADAITVDGTTLATYIRDTVGTNMLSSNTESGIAVTYDTTNDNIDFALDAAQTVITSVYNTSLKAGRDADNLIDFATTDNKIILRVNGVDEVELVENALSPVTDNGVSIGTSSLMWSDLFLADGGVIYFNNTDVTLTHSSNTLTLAGGILAVPTASTIGNLTLGDGSITDSSGAISFGNENLSTTGTLAAGTTTIGTLVLAAASITDSSGTVSFGDENVTTTGVVTATGFTIGSAAIVEAELETLDGITAGTAAASKAMVLDSNADITGGRNLTISGELDAATGDFSGAVDIAGALTLSGGDMDVSDQNMSGIKTATFNSLVNGGSASSGTIALNWANGMKQYVTLSGNVTITMAAPAGPCNVMLKIVHSGGGRTVTWSDSVATIYWPEGTAPTLSSSAGTDIVAFFFDGTAFYGSASVAFA